MTFLQKEVGSTPLNSNPDGKVDSSVSTLFPQRQSKNSPRLRHRVSHDVLVQDRKSSFSSVVESAGMPSQRQSYSNAYRAIAHRRSSSSARLSNFEIEELVSSAGSSSMPDLHAIAEGQIGKFSNEIVNEPDSVVDSDVEKDSSHDEASQNDAAAIVDEDYEPETVDDESMVYLTPFTDTADPKPFQVEAADQNNLDEVDGEHNEKDDEDEQTMHSDTDSSMTPSQTFTAEDSDSSSEDNADEALVQSIAMRNPPPMSTLRKASLKRSGRMSLRSIVQSFNAIKPGSEQAHQKEHSRGESFSTLKRKMEQAKKRLSFSTRYLSNLNTENLGMTDNIKIDEGLKARDISMPIAPLEVSCDAGSTQTTDKTGIVRIPLVLTAAELAEINNVKGDRASEPAAADHRKSTSESLQASSHTDARKEFTTPTFGPEQIFPELSAIDNRLDLFVRACESNGIKQSIDSQAEMKDKLRETMLHVQAAANRFLEEFCDSPQTDQSSAPADAATATLLNEYSDKLIQMVESKLNLKHNYR